jgi:hypothetical protein
MTGRMTSGEAIWRDGWDVRTGRLQGKEISSFTIYDIVIHIKNNKHQKNPTPTLNPSPKEK